MRKNHTYFPRATAQQRKLLFETWEATGSVTKASEKAHLSRTTFYWWKARFDEQGYAGLVDPKPTVRKHQQRVAQAIADQIIQLRTDHPDWGKKRIADELAKAHDWVPLVSPNSVRRILQEAGLWPPATLPAQKKRTRHPNAPGGATRPNGERGCVLCALGPSRRGATASGEWFFRAPGGRTASR